MSGEEYEDTFVITLRDQSTCRVSPPASATMLIEKRTEGDISIAKVIHQFTEELITKWGKFKHKKNTLDVCISFFCNQGDFRFPVKLIKEMAKRDLELTVYYND